MSLIGTEQTLSKKQQSSHAASVWDFVNKFTLLKQSNCNTFMVKIKYNENRTHRHTKLQSKIFLSFCFFGFASACVHLKHFPALLPPLSRSLSVLLSAATCASYNFSFLSPQGLNFSSSQSQAPFWSGTIYLSFPFPRCLSCVLALHLL